MSMESQFSFGSGGARRKDPEDPRRILILADLSGRGGSSSSPPVRIDIDNFETVFRQIRPTLSLTTDQHAVELEFGTFEGFEPDELLKQAPLQPLRDARRQAQSGADRESVFGLLQSCPFVAEISGSDPETSASPSSSSPSAGDDSSTQESESDLMRLLGREASADRDKPQVDISKLLQNVVKGHVVPPGKSSSGDLAQVVEEASSGALRRVLHAPAFQRLEASWLALRRAVFSCSDEQVVQFFVLDVSHRQLIEELGSASDWRGTSLFQAIVESGRGPWDLIASDFAFSPNAEEITSLAMLGGIAAEGGAPFVAGASPALLGCDSLADAPRPADWIDDSHETLAAWNQLRKSGMATWIGLTIPRTLLRLPYGADTSPVDSFDFEEVTADFAHEQFLWGGYGLVHAELAARAYESGSDVATSVQIDELPVFSFSRDGEMQMKPCAEVFLSEIATAALVERGLMPLASFQNRDAARLVRWQSIAEPSSALAGL